MTIKEEKGEDLKETQLLKVIDSSDATAMNSTSTNSITINLSSADKRDLSKASQSKKNLILQTNSHIIDFVN